ncbi:MAG: hypothetical protein M5U10_03465 [Candidatus Methanoperedens sp.]|uniref:hypothetical protein n=1 Tax=Candidatus Methanoperedens nitratireducens TaxID=1392998 RepID=UPI0012FF3562|nr:hypothetical protein [Candidatus Methanoperedens nitroreducens]MDJ1420957.1 hypothetical protein [Candidatus Methanoperedens sp.]
MVPLEIERGQLKSKILDDIITKDDCITENDKGLLTINQRCKSKISNPIELTYKKEFKALNIYKGSAYTFCGDIVKLQPRYSPDMAKIAPLIPNTPDLGALFTIPVNSKIFELFLPLYQDDDETIIFEINSNISKPSAYGKYEETRAHINRFLTDYDSSFNVDDTLYKFLNTIYPLSICSYNEYCITEAGELHKNSPVRSEDYLNNSKRLKNSRCYCGRDVSFKVTQLKSERIKKDFINGVFSEWYASKKIESAGLDNTLWNTDIIFNDSTEIHSDAIGFNDDLIILMECKRIYNENNDFRGAIKKLNKDKELFQEKYNDKDVVIGLMTNFHNSNTIPQNIDFNINHDNFLDFEDILRDYV